MRGRLLLTTDGGLKQYLQSKREESILSMGTYTILLRISREQILSLAYFYAYHYRYIIPYST